MSVRGWNSRDKVTIVLWAELSFAPGIWNVSVSVSAAHSFSWAPQAAEKRLMSKCLRTVSTVAPPHPVAAPGCVLQGTSIFCYKPQISFEFGRSRFRIMAGQWFILPSVSSLRTRRSGFRIPAATKRFFCSPKRPDRLWAPPSLQVSGYRSSFRGIKRLGGVQWIPAFFPGGKAAWA